MNDNEKEMELLLEYLEKLPKEHGPKGSIANAIKMNILRGLMECAGMGQIFCMLLDFPECENYLVIPVSVDDGSDRDFEIILHKCGKLLPSDDKLKEIWS